MNKKGALFHWAVFGVIAALGFFFIFSDTINIAQEIPGKWSFDFLYNQFYPAEVDLLHKDSSYYNYTQEIIQDLAKQGGFIINSSCGKVNEISLWNNDQEWCYPTVKEDVIALFMNRFPQIKEADFSETFLIGKTEKFSQQSANASYIYSGNFKINLNYDFAVYNTMYLDAQTLVWKCEHNQTLITCVENNLPEDWHYGDCENEVYPVNSREWGFCVEEYGIKHYFALDFI